MRRQMGKKSETGHPAILLDADVVIHFNKGEQIFLLPKIFPNNKLLILNKVIAELEAPASSKHFAENILNYGIAEIVNFENDIEVKLEYARLTKKFGKGESACMAYCRYHKNILASSNIRDVKEYCDQNGIQLLTTMDFLVRAFNTGLLDEAACDYFIFNVKFKGSILPCDHIAEYIASKSSG